MILSLLSTTTICQIMQKLNKIIADYGDKTTSNKEEYC